MKSECAAAKASHDESSHREPHGYSHDWYHDSSQWGAYDSGYYSQPRHWDGWNDFSTYDSYDSMYFDNMYYPNDLWHIPQHWEAGEAIGDQAVSRESQESSSVEIPAAMPSYAGMGANMNYGGLADTSASRAEHGNSPFSAEEDESPPSDAE